ncbi:MAG: DNA polymerase I [Acidimicrobiia bacterium]
MTKLLLLDGHSLAYRAFYALPTDLATPEGTVTNAAYGFTSMLVKVLTEEQPDYIAVAFDMPTPTFRHELDTQYKAQREESPELFRSQLPLIHEVLGALAIRRIERSGVEADDIIATLATQADREGIDTIIVTGDRDSYQLVQDPHIKVLYNKRGVSDYALYDEAGIEERTGVTPEQYPEYAALRGDPSDNLPGVPGIGEKTAAKLVTTYGTLEQIFEHLDELPPKQRENLGAARERVLLNRRMSVLLRDVDLGVTLQDLRPGVCDAERVRQLFQQLAFHSLLGRLGPVIGARSSGTVSAPVDAVELETVSIGSLDALRDGLAAHPAGMVALAADWSGTPGASELRGIALAFSEATAHYVPAGVVTSARAELHALFAGDERVVVHGAKELIRTLECPTAAGLAWDTAVMAYLLDPGERSYDLEALALRELGLELTSPDRPADTLDFDGSAGVEAAGRRAAATLALAPKLQRALEARELVALYHEIERPLIPILAVMERVGIRVDTDFLGVLSAKLNTERDALEAQIHAHAGSPFNVNSTPQLRTVLFEQLGLTPVKKTKTGPSTDAESLQKLLGAHPIIEDLLRYREVEKLRSTYVDALPPLIAGDGRVHATFNQLATTTGRISSEHPNLQNIPIRTEEGREIRRAFIAADGCKLVAADYSQIELRVLAHLAEDSGLIDALTRDVDVHTVTAARVFHVAEDAVDADQRRFAKVVNYGLAYGMEAYGLGQRMGIPTGEAQGILDAYFASFPQLHAYMQHTVAEAKARGYTTTLFGRRRQIAELASDNFRIRQMGERMAQNAPVQGTAADIFKLAMIHADAALRTGHFETRMLLTVHDELVFEVPEHELETVVPALRAAMEEVCILRVPLVVDIGIGYSWADAK